MINPGKLNKKISIQKQGSTKDQYGHTVETWDVFKNNVWASVDPIVGKEYFAAETVNSEVTHKIRFRYLPGIDPSMRIVYKNRKFSIQSAINYKEANIEWQLMCRELI